MKTEQVPATDQPQANGIYTEQILACQERERRGGEESEVEKCNLEMSLTRPWQNERSLHNTLEDGVKGCSVAQQVQPP